MINANNYQVLIFDCDGVLIDSNQMKSDAFYNVIKPISISHAEDLREFNIKNGGKSRYIKFNYIIEKIKKDLPEKIVKINDLLDEYSNIVKQGYVLSDLSLICMNYEKKNNAVWYIASGSDQAELREILSEIGISDFFEGIFGSPKDKNEIIKDLSASFSEKILFFGDSQYDYICAKNNNIDFIFINEWSELKNWKDYCKENGIKSFRFLHEAFA